MKRVCVLALLALGLGGCAGLAGTVDSLAKDPATDCLVLGTPYGTLVVARAARTGVRVIASAGQCSVEHGVMPPPAAGKDL
jgi:hypothetical protein